MFPDIWTAEGLQRLIGFSACFGAYALFGRRIFLPLALGIGLVWSVYFAGPGVLGALFVLASLYSLGRLLRCSPAVALPAGVAVAVFAMSVTAGIPIHTRWLWLGLLAIPLLFRREMPKMPEFSPSLALLVWVLALHWLVALKPEVSDDGLAMHLVVPAFVAEHRMWPFDVTRFLWSVMPMNGDWLFTMAYLIGGEACARLVNFGLLVGTCALLRSLTGSYLVAA